MSSAAVGDLARMLAVLDEHSRLEHAFDFEATMQTMTADCCQHHPSIALRTDGKPACTRHYEEIFGAFPDFMLDQDGIASAPGNLVAWGSLSATMTGPWLGIDATGHSLELPLVAIIEFRDDRVVGETLHYDSATWCRQLSLRHDQLLDASARFTASWSGVSEYGSLGPETSAR